MNSFISPYILHYLLLLRVPRWLVFEKRKKTIARLGSYEVPNHPLTIVFCDTNSFHFPSCSFITIISNDISCAKYLALQVPSYQPTIPATLQINENPYQTSL